MEELEKGPGNGSQVPWYQACQRDLWITGDGFSCSDEHGTLKDCLMNSFQSPCVSVIAVLLVSRVVFCLRHFLTGPHLLMWQFILSGCLLFRPNVLTGQRLVYDGSRRVSAHLIPSAAGGRGMTVFSQAWRVLLPKVISLGTDRSNVFFFFFGNLVGAVYSEQNCGLFGSGKSNSKVC